MTPAPPLPARARMWWHAREPRERWLLALFAVLLAGVLIVTLVARPLLDARAAAWRDIDATARNAPPRPAGPTATTPARPAGDPVALARDSAARFGLTVVVSAAGQGVRVTIADAPAESVLRWLAALEESGALRVTAARIERRPAPGMVAARLLAVP